MFKLLKPRAKPPIVPVCPYCGAKNIALGSHARKGDIAICDGCCRPAMIEVKPLRLRKPKNRKEAQVCDSALEIVKKEV
jgi:hypothetical protein